jgi:hypothetical protein
VLLDAIIRDMRRGPITLLLNFGLLLFIPNLVSADVWRCPRPDGTDLYTDRLKDPATCEKYELKTELGYASAPQQRDPIPALRVPEERIQLEEAPYPDDRRGPPDTRFYRSDEESYYDDTQAYDDYEEYYPYTGYGRSLYWFSNKPRLLKPKPRKVTPVPSADPAIVPPTVRPFPDVPRQSINPTQKPPTLQRR